METTLVVKNPPLWLINLREMKNASNLSTKQIIEKTNLPERTVTRIFSGETDHPRIDTIYIIVKALGGTLNDIFADTNIVVASESLVEIKENVDIVTAERDLIVAENAMLKDKVTALTTENELLKMQIMHKEELLALHNYYNKLKHE